MYDGCVATELLNYATGDEAVAAMVDWIAEWCEELARENLTPFLDDLEPDGTYWGLP